MAAVLLIGMNVRQSSALGVTFGVLAAVCALSRVVRAAGSWLTPTNYCVFPAPSQLFASVTACAIDGWTVWIRSPLGVVELRTQDYHQSQSTLALISQSTRGCARLVIPRSLLVLRTSLEIGSLLVVLGVVVWWYAVGVDGALALVLILTVAEGQHVATRWCCLRVMRAASAVESAVASVASSEESG